MNELSHKIEEIINNFILDNKLPGLSLQIVSDCKSNFTYEYGVSNIDLKKPMKQDTISSIMSLSKSFTALAMLHLEENNDFNLDTPVIEYLPYFKAKSGEYVKITSKQILSHTAGFPDNIWLVSLLDNNLLQYAKKHVEYHFIFEQFPTFEVTISKIKTREDITRYFSNITLDYKPGEGWQYCTDAYAILADIVEKVSGLSWEDYVLDKIIIPLGLTNTHINPSTASLQNMSEYYSLYNNRFINVTAPTNRLGAPVGFIYSTTNDMAKYLIALMGSEQKIISLSTRDKMFSMIAQRAPGLSYGLGWKIKNVRDLNIVEHAGGYPGVSSFAAMIPTINVGLVMLCNTDGIPLQNLSDQILDILI
ncbi:serine hydrolase domain-containing protein [Alkalicoccobacillus gibsonii]|uniref:serine hydrolase domain-containing protein n=1 Tax=Alkalicoccobacillus gibsonii TaxID=79881 RepID=UPI0019311B52|nr:serine hydrolase domain-containing protein [Alkalicoccobacillus gibsonii]MBM0066797.1 beta-lactamase family protein [Alkalicoccobacillus gibsonii]